MFRYLVRRILWAILLFVVITFVTFVIFFMAPENPGRTVCGGERARPQCIAQATKQLGLDKPIPVQYGKFLKRLVVDRSLGNSYITEQPVNDVIKDAAPVTASLVFGGAVLWLMVGLVVGVFSALKPRSLIDRVAMIGVLIGVSAHPVWIGLIFSYFFGFKWGLTPITGYCEAFSPATSDCGGVVDWAHHLVL